MIIANFFCRLRAILIFMEQIYTPRNAQKGRYGWWKSLCFVGRPESVNTPRERWVVARDEFLCALEITLDECKIKVWKSNKQNFFLFYPHSVIIKLFLIAPISLAIYICNNNAGVRNCWTFVEEMKNEEKFRLIIIRKAQHYHSPLFLSLPTFFPNVPLFSCSSLSLAHSSLLLLKPSPLLFLFALPAPLTISLLLQ